MRKNKLKRVMKNFYTSIILTVFAATGFTQTILYTNNFDTPGTFTLDEGQFNNWAINSVYTGGALFQGGVIPNVPSQPGSFTNPNQNYLHPLSPLAIGINFQVIQNANYTLAPGFAPQKAVMNTGVDASDYQNITLSFWRTGGLNGMQVIYSIDGGATWLSAGLTFQGSPATWIEETIVISALDGQSDVRIGFEMTELSLADPIPSHYHSIDEITITGTPNSGEISATIATPGASFCEGQEIAVNYQIVSGNISGNNQFTLEISDASGNFDSATSIGTLTSTASSGTITGTLPIGLFGNNFRVRVNASNQVIEGNDNGSDIAITPLPEVSNITLNANGSLEVTVSASSFEWLLNGMPVPNSQNQSSITATFNGNYTVVASNGSCTSTSETFTVNFVSIQEENQVLNYVYPNPVNSTLQLNYDANEIQAVYISDISGKIIFESNEGVQTIDFTGFMNGIYFVHFVGDSEQIIKVIKQ